MSVADELLKANQEFVKNFNLGDLAVKPRRRVAVLACMDSRILFERCLGLQPGDAHMIRNAGGIATEDALRSLIVSHHLLETQEFIIINHTDCGLLKVKEYELRSHLTSKMNAIASEPAHFYAFDDLEANLREQVREVKSHPWIPKNIPVRGFIYDVKTGKLTEAGLNVARAPSPAGWSHGLFGNERNRLLTTPTQILGHCVMRGRRTASSNSKDKRTFVSSLR